MLFSLEMAYNEICNSYTNGILSYKLGVIKLQFCFLHMHKSHSLNLLYFFAYIFIVNLSDGIVDG